MHNRRPTRSTKSSIYIFKLAHYVNPKQKVQGSGALHKEIGTLSLKQRQGPAVMWAVRKVHTIVGEMRSANEQRTGRGG